MKKGFVDYGFPIFFFLCGLLVSCDQTKESFLFTSLSPSATGINFNNEIHDSDSTYSFINEFGYMGGGVGIGDFNNDGKKDIFFTGNQVSCRLYINQGDNKFEDITNKAGVGTDVWCTGVSIVDLNQDGYDDIYVCVFGKDLKHRSKNLLFINQHDLTFKESAATFGLADTGFSTQAVFLDYDRDGDLDMYLANYLLTTNNSNTIYPRDKTGFSSANDRLYRNDGDSVNRGYPIFTDQTIPAGIKEDGYGLGISVSDFNNDGWPDIYVANDFVSNDLLWQNNKDGSFSNCISKSLRHQSYSSMGSDAADLNNDTLTDIVTLDMLPETNERKKTSFSLMNYERYESERNMGYEPEFMRNMLQLNNGNSVIDGVSTPVFSEIGRLSGIHATDWSWSVLLADFDNDGWKDMHITNGIGRDFIDADFLEFSNSIFNSYPDKKDRENAIRKKLASLENVNLPNYLYHNNGDLTFSDISGKAGIDEPSMSNGAAYADLDNDGDLDLVVNNINRTAFVFINNANQQGKTDAGHYLKLQLEGDNQNRKGFGSRIYIYNKGETQMLEQNPVRGYFSSVDQQLIVGLGKEDHADSVMVVWPDGKKQLLKNVTADTSLTFSWKNAGKYQNVSPAQVSPLFTDITGSSGFNYLHQDNPFNDYTVQRLLPQKFSQLGPFISTGDINNDGTTDFFIGGAFNSWGKLFSQVSPVNPSSLRDGPGNRLLFTSAALSDSVKFEEDLNCTLFDADTDGDSDLLVTGGGMLYEADSRFYKPRLYLNNGKGVFSLQAAAIADSVKTTGGNVSAFDYDGDGDADLFIGGRVSQQYPLSPRSYLLQNNRGQFTDVTASVCPDLEFPGMVTAAVWTDFDNDKQTDLVLTGEWMPLRFFKNNRGRLVDVTTTTGLENMNGMWRSLISTDVDNDGDPDLVAGNLGLNCEYHTGPSEPMELYATDLDGNGSIDPFFFYYIKTADGGKKLVPGTGRGRLAEQVPSLKKQFLLNEDFAHATYQDIFKGKPVKNLLRLFCDETRSCYFENLGNGKFRKHVLPVEAQFSPVNAIICEDLDQDGIKDLVLAGNEYQAEVMTGMYDASYGSFLRGNRNKTFTSVPQYQSGLLLNGDIKDLSLIRLANGERILIAAVNNDSMRVLKINRF
ncbi:MAG: VCBS repeat-containing protein [Chitinophagaceae bacterium]